MMDKIFWLAWFLGAGTFILFAVSENLMFYILAMSQVGICMAILHHNKWEVNEK